MGGGEKVTYKVPDYRIYKIDGIKELEWVQRNLAAKGLKDPWLRNEVWRYQQWEGFWPTARKNIFRGFKYAVIGMGITIFLDWGCNLGLGGKRYMRGHDDHH